MNEVETSSRGYLLWNNSAKLVIGEQETNTPVPVASLTKIMTALLVLEHRNLDEEVTITAEMLEGLEEFSIIGLQVGQVATVEDLLYATMLPSAGDAAQALAISTAGSIAEFVEWMNRETANFGMGNTHFSNPVGFDAGTRNGVVFDWESEEDLNYSTPQDMVILLQKALQDERFRTIFETYERGLPSLGLTARKTFAQNGYILGGKTGFTNAAGRCLASTAKIEGQEYILVTVGAEGEEHVADAEQIYRAVEENYEPVKLVSAGDTLVRIGVEGSPTKMLEFRSPIDIIVALPNDYRAEDLTYSYEGNKDQTTVGRWTYPEEPFGSWRVGYQGVQLGGIGLTLHESCDGYAEEMYCVRMPEFYNYGWMLLGVVVTLFLAGLTVWEFLKTRRQRTPKTESLGDKAQKIAPWAGLVMTLVSLAVTGFICWDCFRAAPEVEVLAPEVKVITDEGSDTPEEPEEDPNDEGNNEEVENGAAELGARGLGNCTTGLGNLMLINPNFPVGTDFIAARRQQLISVSQTYGIQEYHAAGNGDNLMIPEAAAKLAEMLAAYSAENPGHEMGTYSCFRSQGTKCGRLCAATGESDHHTGLTCDLIDLAYGSVLSTDAYPEHLEWQWLRANSYKYGFIDRFPEAWAGGLMTEPLNVDENGSTGLFETWHYRYVGVTPATEIATGRYNNGAYDSLEHYLKATGRVEDLKGGVCTAF